jgi:hypothetical protein
MGKRLSKRIRDKAADLCAISASSDRHMCIYDVQVALGDRLQYADYASDDDVSLAWDAAARAYWADSAREMPSFSRERYAEAEALLRSGWEPST